MHAHTMYTEAEVDLALGRIPADGPIDAPAVAATYGDATYALLDYRDLLGTDPDRQDVFERLVHAETFGADGIMVPLTKTTSECADIIHAGDRGWYLYTSNGLYAHVPGDDPIFRVAICFTRTRYAFDGTGYAVYIRNDKRDKFTGARTTPYVKYVDGAVVPL